MVYCDVGRGRNLIKLLIADDQPMYIAGLETTVRDAGMEVLEKLQSSDQLAHKYFQLLPDILISNVRFGHKLSGLDVTALILEKNPSARIILISGTEEENLIRQSYMTGAKAFLPKSVDRDQLITAIENVYAGDIHISPEIAIRLTKETFSQQNKRVDLESILTERELQIFKLLANGSSDKEIAEKLNISQKTIWNDKTSIRDKIGGLNRRSDYTKLAIKENLISLD